ncbi:MAG TPA: GreA/GreB family elongation factor, partial [Ferruginibacter sp.]|nr:GreA/GreB family elongation factor [Ferruginibacter sp.]
SQLEAELKRAEVVDNSELPSDVVSLNSSVTVKEMRSGSRMTLKIVIPELANVKEKRISILSPIGTALIGFRKADIVQWTVPSGEKTFLIEDV